MCYQRSELEIEGCKENLVERVLPLPGQDHATLALVPFPLLNEAERHKPIRIAYRAMLDGQSRHVTVTLTPGAELGLPLPADQVVLLTLLQYLLASPDPTKPMSFKTTQLFRDLGWSGGGRCYEMLRDSLKRLAGVLVTVDKEMKARNGQPYRRASVGAHLLDTFQFSDRGDSKCMIEWGYIVREAYELGDLKRLDWDLVQALPTASAVQLYRFLDRAVLAGETRYEVDWTTLATAVGMSTQYAKPSLFRQRIEPHINDLVKNGFIDHWQYKRGGLFVFLLPNYLRSALRRLLTQQGVYAEAARQLVAGYDEVRILCQLDNLTYRGAKEPGGYLTQAIRNNYPLTYPDDEREAFVALWSLLLSEERTAYHRAALKLVGVGLFDSLDDPAEWSCECRAVVRALITNNLDPALV